MAHGKPRQVPARPVDPARPERSVGAIRLRRLGPRHRARADALVEALLGRGEAVTTAATWPLLLDHPERSERWILTEGDEVLSHGGLLLHDHVTRSSLRDPSVIRVGVIGAMVTASSHRGRGLATELLRHLIARGRTHRAWVVMLWSGDERLYERSGFVRAGRELRVTVHPGASAPRDGRTRPVTPADLPHLRRLHEAEEAHTLRDPATWRTHLGIPVSQAFVNERRGEVVAYAVVGKGLDLIGHVHELGGDDDALHELLRDVADAAATPLPVLLPPWREDLAHRLGDAEVHQHAFLLLNGPLDHVPFLTGFDSA